jgi:hypothetical protein
MNPKEKQMITNKNLEYVKITINEKKAVVNNTRTVKKPEVIKLSFVD